MKIQFNQKFAKTVPQTNNKYCYKCCVNIKIYFALKEFHMKVLQEFHMKVLKGFRMKTLKRIHMKNLKRISYHFI